MITKVKLDIYNRFYGDIDGWVRVGSNEEKSIMTDNDWCTIENFIQDIYLQNTSLLSPSYTSSINERLKKHCDSEDTIEAIKELAARIKSQSRL